MKKTLRLRGTLTITPQSSPHWGPAEHAQETEAFRSSVWLAVQKLIAEEFPGCGVVFAADHVAVCSHCDLVWEELTAEEAADDSTNQDVHSVEGEPVCCFEAIAEFRKERGIPALAEAPVDDPIARRDWLLAEIRKRGGTWTAIRAEEVLHRSPWPSSGRNTARKDLRALSARGALIARDNEITKRRTYTARLLNLRSAA
ncbi:hypothetical protein ACQ86F_31845 [Streptomyces venezuelae ATCC 10712]